MNDRDFAVIHDQLMRDIAEMAIGFQLLNPGGEFYDLAKLFAADLQHQIEAASRFATTRDVARLAQDLLDQDTGPREQMINTLNSILEYTANA